MAELAIWREMLRETIRNHGGSKAEELCRRIIREIEAELSKIGS